jgi:hypothetical protein
MNACFQLLLRMNVRACARRARIVCLLPLVCRMDKRVNAWRAYAPMHAASFGPKEIESACTDARGKPRFRAVWS